MWNVLDDASTAPPRPTYVYDQSMPSQVRIDDDLAEWLALQGGSLSAAANRTLAWAKDAIEAAEAEEPEPEPRYPEVSYAHPPEAPNAPQTPAQPRRARTSANAARRMSFSPIIRRPGR